MDWSVVISAHQYNTLICIIPLYNQYPPVQHPFGYEDTDVYGYSPPTAYPIRCQTPEDRLSSPRLELVQGGARMQLALPAEVLQERCRLYMEVRMLPR